MPEGELMQSHKGFDKVKPGERGSLERSTCQLKPFLSRSFLTFAGEALRVFLEARPLLLGGGGGAVPKHSRLLSLLEAGEQGGTEGDVCVFRKPWSGP